MMKGLAPPMIALATILIVAGVVWVSYSGFVSIPGTLLIDGCQFIQPQFGRIECEQISSYVRSSTATFSGNNKEAGLYAKFGDTENGPVGDWSVLCVDSTLFEFQLNDITGTGLLTECDIDSDKWCAMQVNSGQLSRVFDNVQPGEVIRIGGCYNEYIVTRTYHQGYFYEGWEPFGLIVYDSGGKYRYNTQSCNFKAFSEVSRVCVDDECGRNINADILPFFDWVNYLSSYTFAPIDVNNKIVTYNGQDAYCQVNRVYSISEITTEGACYKTPDELIASVDCCPGMATATQTCNDDFKWVLIAEEPPSCFSAIQCPGQGDWIPDYSTPANDLMKYNCIRGECEVIDRKDVPCTPPNIGCPSGQVCNPNKGFICETQTGPGLICGDRVCSAPYEDASNCPEDCEVFNVFNFLATFIGTFIVGVIIMAIALIILMFALPMSRPFITNPKFAIVMILGGALLMSVFFTVPLLAVAALVML